MEGGFGPFLVGLAAVMAAFPGPVAGQSLIQSEALSSVDAAAAGEPLFEKLRPTDTGIDLIIPVEEDHPLARAYYSSSACSGVAIGDLDLDGRPDIFAGSGPGPNRLYLQTGEFAFEDVSKQAGIEGGELAWAVGISLVDIDNDGDLDAYVCNYDHPNHLFINLTIQDGKRSDGPLKFEDQAASCGLDVNDGSVVSAFADYDRDGDLDLYLLNHQVYRENGRPTEMIPLKVDPDTGKIEVTGEWLRWYRVDQNQLGRNGELLYFEAGRPDRFFRNDGEGTFTEVTEEAGISPDPNWGNSATWWDYNNDGWPDLYVGNDFASPDLLYRNNGDGTFTEVAEQTVRNTTWFSMGAVQSDFNNDGFLDLMLGDMLPKTHYMKKASTASMRDRLDNMENVGGAPQTMRNVLHINTGTDQLMEGAWMSGVAATEWTWAIRSADFDNDTRADLVFCNGVPRQFNHSDLPERKHQHLVGRTQWDYLKHLPERREQNLAYRNVGDFQFEDVSQAWGLDHVGMSYGASIGDLNGDGHMELLTSNLNDPLSVYRNRGTQTNRVLIDLRGRESNRMGVGSLVTLRTPDGVTQSRQLFPYGGFLDADECVIHFGLGQQTSIETLRVDWPSGHKQVFRDLAINQRYRITEPQGGAKPEPAVESRKPEHPWFVESDVTVEIEHRERDFDDFQLQPLLPFKLSQLGPGQAWGDFDADGDEDFYFGGAGGQAGQLFRNETSPGSLEIRLTPVLCPDLEADKTHEDMGALFLDVDGDGDQDLYVVSGGVECEPGSELLRDRIYLNQGQGSFERASQDWLPDLRWSGSVVAPADFDRDGDLDLFVGSRSIPGFYPESPHSILLCNQGGRFEQVEHTFLQTAGLVTSALWSDVDQDGWMDLFLTTDWGPIQLLMNREGTLEPATEAAGLDGPSVALRGWWNGIAGGDLDGDGDTDYVATNMGRNTQYQASLKSPELLFYGDFDQSGKRHIIEAQFLVENGVQICYPRRGFMAAADAMPMLADRMQTFDNYARQPLTGIYDVRLLENAQQFRANCMDSIALINDGSGRFEPRPLPHLAQASPGFGICLTDIDLDGLLDVYLVQNHFEPPEEIGLMGSGLSLLLRGTGQPEHLFTPVWSRDSGLEVPGDAKSLATVDVNQDGRPDFMVGVNNSRPHLFLNRTVALRDTTPLRVRLRGKAGNLSAIGARTRLQVSGFPDQHREITGGGSYLAQSSAELVFAVPNTLQDGITLEVIWPDGTPQTLQLEASEKAVTLEQE